jgi:predicted RNA-binding protein with RPS1 domain
LQMSDEQIAQSGDEPEAGGEPQAPASGEAQAATATETGEPKPAVGQDVAAPEAAVVETKPEPASEAAAEPEAPAEIQPVVEAPAPEPPVAEPETPAEIQSVVEAPAPEPPAAEPAAAPAIPTPAAPLDEVAEFEAALSAFEGEHTGTSYDKAYRRLSRGELLTARVIQVDKDKVFVDLGTKSEGVVPIDELSSEPFENVTDVVKPGDEIRVVVINPEGREGNPIVSRKRAEFEAAWDRILEEFERKDTVSAIVTERVKGGLVVDLGVRGFVPATHVGSGQVRNLDKFVGQSMQFKIIEVDRDRRKVVLSNRLAEEETREERKKHLFEAVKPGDILEGTVRRLVDYGAFVDLGGVDGLLHVSEMSWSRVDHPKEVLREGDDVKVMVLRLDANSGRISLGRRQVLPDPWSGIKDHYQVGQRLTLPISRVVQAGAFVKLPEGAEAFIPISEMAHRRISKPSEVVEPGQEVEIQVIDLRPDERRMVLSMRALLPYEEQQRQQQQQDVRHRSERSRGRERAEPMRHQSAPAGGMTIGERLSALRGLQGTFDDDEQAEEPSPAEEPAPSEAPVEEPSEG